MTVQDIKKHKRAGEAVKKLLRKIERAKQEWESMAGSLPELVCLGRGQVAYSCHL